MQIQIFNMGVLSTNCYVINCPETKEAMIIDPGFDAPNEAELILHYTNSRKLKVRFIVNTHGHADHISGDTLLKRIYRVPICIHTQDGYFLDGFGENVPPDNIMLEDKELLKIGRKTLKVIHTPGHTSGSISLVGKKLVFTGDTLFSGGIGRTDFAEGSVGDMRESLKKLLCLPNNYLLYPGHGASSTIGEERRTNPFLQCL